MEEITALIGSRAARNYGRPFGNRVSDMVFNLGQSRFIDQRSSGHAVCKTIADNQFFGRRFQLGREGVIDTSLHIDAIGADAGLTIVAVFCDHRAFDGGVQVGIVKDDKRRVATQFKRHFLDCVRALVHQNFADAG